MKMSILLPLLLLPMLGACSHSLIRVNTGGQGVSGTPSGTSVTTSRIQASTESRLGAAIIIAVLLAEGLRYFRVEPDGTRTPVDAATAERLGVSHKVSVQDCTQPVDLTAGNLVCR
jgi:hypothetical protein